MFCVTQERQSELDKYACKVASAYNLKSSTLQEDTVRLYVQYTMMECLCGLKEYMFVCICIDSCFYGSFL